MFLSESLFGRGARVYNRVSAFETIVGTYDEKRDRMDWIGVRRDGSRVDITGDHEVALAINPIIAVLPVHPGTCVLEICHDAKMKWTPQVSKEPMMGWRVHKDGAVYPITQFNMRDTEDELSELFVYHADIDVIQSGDRTYELDPYEQETSEDLIRRWGQEECKRRQENDDRRAAERKAEADNAEKAAALTSLEVEEDLIG